MLQSGFFLRIILYLLPAVVDMTTGVIFFVCPVQAVRMGADYTNSSLMITMQGLCYMLGCFLTSRYMNTTNAIRFIMTGCAIIMAACIGLTQISTLNQMLVLVGATGIGASFFFPPFMIFMKGADSQEGNRPVRKMLGLFILSWSLGMSLGPFISGFMLEHGGDWGFSLAYGMAAASLLLVMAGVVWIDKRTISFRHDYDKKELPGEFNFDEETPLAQPTPNLARLGWIFGCIGITALAALRGVFPSGATLAGIPESAQGIVLFLLNFSLAVGGMALSWSRTWMFNGRIMLAIGLLGTVGMALFAVPSALDWGTDRIWPYYLGGIAFGLYSGAVYFYSAYHSLVHPTRAGKYISINEAVLGVGTIIGPLVGGILADRYGMATPFFMMLILIVSIALTQLIVQTPRKIGRASKV